MPAGLPPEAVSYLSDARSTRACLYASMEDLTDRLQTIAHDFEDQGVVIDLVDDDDADSLVQHLELAVGSADGDIGDPPELPEDRVALGD